MDQTNNKEPLISVVLATYNRADTMRTTLQRLIDQDLDHDLYEVVVIDDGSPDNTREVVEEFIARSPCRMTYLRHENRGPGHTINRGIEAARGELCLLMADDIFFVPAALRCHLELHRANPEPEVAVLGKVIQAPDLVDNAFLRHWDPFQFNDIPDGVTELPWRMFWACSISVKREFMRTHGMFRDERGRGGAPAHEDVEVGYRLSRHGLRILYSEEALGEHFHVYTVQQAIRRYYERGLNWDEFYGLAPEPELLVDSRVLTRTTLPLYMDVLRDSNTLNGREGSLTWHLVRHALRRTLFNRVTDAVLWGWLLKAADKSRLAEAFVSRRLYAGYLHYHFMRGVRDAHGIYTSGDGKRRHVADSG